ncbi:uncharacterized protein LOC129581061 [Paramacrobiotus metropolitanus]|uniref:uncharacterized protein LOC129581061 n=1 Tax=Paramacrobiotus metropolitanus TaxID=2943436 RepID=UPI0024460046|nr:uncharacterized protein LOC129581061 [Paramacrobiotus metropolitanus]
MAAFKAVAVIFAIALNGWFLRDWTVTAYTAPPIEYIFECDSSPTNETYKKITDLRGARCSEPVTTLITKGSPDNVKYQVHYTCQTREEPVQCNETPRDIQCTTGDQCRCCLNVAMEALCQDERLSLRRFLRTCKRVSLPVTDPPADPAEDEVTVIYEVPSEITATTVPTVGNHVSGRPYCPDGNDSILEGSCFVPALMIVVDKGNCLQKITAGVPTEKVAGSDYTVNIAYWSSGRHETWNGLSPIPATAFNTALRVLDDCNKYNVCSKCKKLPLVKVIIEQGYAVPTTLEEVETNDTTTPWAPIPSAWKQPIYPTHY